MIFSFLLLIIVRSAWLLCFTMFVGTIRAKTLLMWILFSIIFCIPYSVVEYLDLALLKDLLWVLVKIEVVALDKFFRWLQSTAPYKFIISILGVALAWYRKVWKIGKVILWLLFCLLVLPKLLFVLLYIAVYLIVWWEGFSIIFLVLFLATLVTYLHRFTIFLKKIIKKGEVCSTKNYEEIITLDVSAFTKLRKALISRVLALTKKLGLSNELSSLVVRVYTAISDLLFFLSIGLYWSAIFWAIVYCIVEVSPSFVLFLAAAILFNWWTTP